MLKNLGITDIVIIICYFAILIAIGQFLKRKASNSIEDYFLAGRKIPWWILGLSSMSAWLDMTGTMLITSFLFILGPRGLFVELRGGTCLVLAFLMLWVGKWHRRSGVMTFAEWMIFRFGSDSWGQFARISTVFAVIVSVVGMLAYTFKGAGLFLSMFLPLSPAMCSLLLVIVTSLYTIQAGFYGVVFTDLLQSACILIGMVFIAVLAISKVNSTEELSAVAMAVTGNTQWTSILPQRITPMPKGYEGYQFLIFVSLFYLIKTTFQGLGMGGDPKYFGAKNDRECGLLAFFCGWSMMIRWPLMMAFVILGLYLVYDLFPDQTALASVAQAIKEHIPTATHNAWAQITADIMNYPANYPKTLIETLRGHLGDDWGRRLSMISFNGTIDPERILPAVLLFCVPMGIRGIVLVALLAAAMGTITAMVNTASGFITRDLYQGYIRPAASNRELIWASYLSGIFLITAAMLMAYITPSINNIWGWLTVGLISGQLAPNILRFYWWRFNGSGFAVGTATGVVCAIFQRSFWPDMHEVWQFLAMTAVGFVGSVIGTYLTPPTDLMTLKTFYYKTKPFGLWKPLFDKLSEEEQKQTKKEHMFDLAALPFAMVWLTTLLMLPLQAMIGRWDAFGVTFIIFSVSLAGLYPLWFKKLPSQDPTAK